MCAAVVAGAAAASAYARAAGTMVELDPEHFLKIATKLQENGALIVHGIAQIGFRTKKDVYLVGNQGIVLYCKNTGVLPLIKTDIEAKNLALFI